MNYHLYLSTKKTNSNKLAPVYAKINFNGKRLERSSGVFVSLKNWNTLYKRVAPNAFGATEANEKINQFENKLKQLMAMESVNLTIINKVLANNENKEANIYTLKSTITAFLEHKEALIDKNTKPIKATKPKKKTLLIFWQLQKWSCWRCKILITLLVKNLKHFCTVKILARAMLISTLNLCALSSNLHNLNINYLQVI